MAILSGFDKQKRYITDSNKDHKLVSEWTHTDTVEFTGGKTLTERNTEVQNQINTLNTLVDELDHAAVKKNVVPTENAIEQDLIVKGTLLAGNKPTSPHVEIFERNINAYNEDPYSVVNRTARNLYICNEGGLLLVGYRSKRPALFTSTPAFVYDDDGSRQGDPETFVGKVLISSPYKGEIVASNYTIAKSVPADAKLTDENVKQTNTTSSVSYRVLLSGTDDNVTRSEGARKSGNLTFNPNLGILYTKGLNVNNGAVILSSTGAISATAGIAVSGGYSSMLGDANCTYLTYRANKSTVSNDVLIYSNRVTLSNNTMTLWRSNASNDTAGNIDLAGGITIGMFRNATMPFIDFCHDDVHRTYRIRQTTASTLDFITDDSHWGKLKAAEFVVASSKHVKENIEDIDENEAKKLLDLRPVKFDYINGDTDKRGLIAEEVMDVLPNMVTVPDDYEQFNPDEPWRTPSIDYSKFVPYLIKMIQIQQMQIDELKRR